MFSICSGAPEAWTSGRLPADVGGMRDEPIQHLTSIRHTEDNIREMHITVIINLQVVVVASLCVCVFSGPALSASQSCLRPTLELGKPAVARPRSNATTKGYQG